MPISPYVIFACALWAALIATPLAVLIGRRTRIPDLSDRQIEQNDFDPLARAIPRTGGLAILIAAGLTLLLALRLGRLDSSEIDLIATVFGGLGLFALVGLLTDTHGIKSARKFLLQFCAAAIVVFAGVKVGLIPEPGIAVAFSLVYLVGGANVVNFPDRMNGLTGGLALIATLALAGQAALQSNWTLVLIALALGGASLGCLPYNFPRAIVFMGGAGRQLVGFALAALTVLLARDAATFAAGLIATALPIVDFGLAITRRTLHMTDESSGAHQQIHDLLSHQHYRGTILGPTRAVWVMYATMIVLGGLSWLIGQLSAWPALILAAGIMATLTGWAIRLGALGSRSVNPSFTNQAIQQRRDLKAALRRNVHVLAIDGLIIVLAFYAALFVRFVDLLTVAPDEFFGHLRSATTFLPFVVVIFLFSNAAIGLYSRWWKYATSRDALPIVKAGLLGGAVTLLIDLLWGAQRPMPIGMVAMATLLVIGGLGLHRFRHRLAEDQQTAQLPPRSRNPASQPAVPERAVIVGADENGQWLARKMQHDHLHRYAPVAFIDDDPHKHGLFIHGVQVKGGLDRLHSVVNDCEADVIALMPDDLFDGNLHMADDRWQALLDRALATSARVQVVSDSVNRLQPGSGLTALRPLQAEDLLPRQPVRSDLPASQRLIRGKVVLVTGAAGSIGSELCRQAIQLGATTVLLVDNNETGLFELQLELGATSTTKVVPIVGDVTDGYKIRNILAAYRPHVIFHAAAYKHMLLMEANPEEAVRVNVGGTQTMAELAAAFSVGYFVLISSDKVVNPSSVMGATKRIAELIVTRMPACRTRFMAVRFGSVLGSRGSVLPVFEKQIAAGGPVTITDAEMTRYFMTIPEAASLLIQAAAVGADREITVLETGSQVSILGLAYKLIRLHGLRPMIDIEIKVTGLRPGEKKHEELFCSKKCPATHCKQPTAVPGIWSTCNACAPEYDRLMPYVLKLRQLAQEQQQANSQSAAWDAMGLHAMLWDVLALQEQTIAERRIMPSPVFHLQPSI